MRPPAGLRLTRLELKQLVLDLAESGPIANSSIRESTGLPREGVKQLLRELVEEGQLVLIGERRGARYVLSSSDELRQLPLSVEE